MIRVILAALTKRRSDPIAVIPAWNLAAGDELTDGVTVLDVRHQAVDRMVRVTTDEPACAELPGDSPITVIRRLF